jgi:crotonobetainyl-CoA:carnitine CoA-transferase CaiB-like acyl-CoA transferase|tara:strand:+ start:95 stop:1300 length:1206 start_codon:yes stop_codon:yes gene_type:complete
MSEKLLFADLKVIDMSSWIAAPVAATMLADFGAQVIKIEPPQAGDGYRNFALMASTPTSDVNYTWQMDNRNKRSLALNLKTEEGRKVLRQLVAECDVYVTNTPHPMRREWGLTYEELATLNSSLIYASLTAYGELGPERDREGFDLVAYWARSGLMDLVRAPGADPAPAIPGMGDHPTAVSLYAAILTALFKRQQTGEGSHVHTSLLANGMWSASCIAQGVFAEADFTLYHQLSSHLFTRLLYEAADGRWLQFSMVRTDEEVDMLFTAIGRPDLLLDPRFVTADLRVEHGNVLVEEMKAALITETAAHWMQVLTDVGVPVALVGRVDELTSDPQVIANDMAITPTPEVGMPSVINHPLNIEGLATRSAGRAPDLGEHSEAILAELGYTATDIARAKEQGVI